MKTADFLLFLNVAGKATCFSGVRNSGSVIPWRTLNIFGPPFLLCKVEWDVLWVPLKLYGNCKKLMKLIFNAFLWGFFETDDGGRNSRTVEEEKPERGMCGKTGEWLIMANSLVPVPPSTSENFLHVHSEWSHTKKKVWVWAGKKGVNFIGWECQA